MGGGQLVTIAAGRFERRGLVGLIAWPASEPVFAARLAGAVRPAWTPHADPRLEALGEPGGPTSITGTARVAPAIFYIVITSLSGHTSGRGSYRLLQGPYTLANFRLAQQISKASNELQPS